MGNYFGLFSALSGCAISDLVVVRYVVAQPFVRATKLIPKHYNCTGICALTVISFCIVHYWMSIGASGAALCQSSSVQRLAGSKLCRVVAFRV